MGRLQDEYATVLAHADLVAAGLARSLLESVGIPCLLHGPDFDFVELGFSAHAAVRGTNVLVPRAALDRARSVLDAAWGEGGPLRAGEDAS